MDGEKKGRRGRKPARAGRRIAVAIRLTQSEEDHVREAADESGEHFGVFFAEAAIARASNVLNRKPAKD